MNGVATYPEPNGFPGITVANGASAANGPNGSNGNGSNGNGSSSTPVNGSESQEVQEIPHIPVPTSKRDLDELVLRYQHVLRLSKDAKDNHDAYTRLADPALAGNPFGHVPAAPPKFIDAFATEKKALERVLAKASRKYEEYIAEEEALYTDMLAALDDSAAAAADRNTDAAFDVTLFEKHIAGLQLLSRDIDLPESLQMDYGSIYTKAHGAGAASSSHAELVDHIVSEYFPRKSPVDFLERAQSVGVDSPKPTTSAGPLTASLGNYYTEQIIAGKISARIQELEAVPANQGTFNFTATKPNNQLDNEHKINALIELKSLQVLAFQKHLKNNFIRKVALSAQYESSDLSNNPLSLQGRRGLYIREKVDQPNPHLLAQQLEDKFKLEAEARKHRLHVKKIEHILENSKQFSEARLGRLNKRIALTKFVNNFHVTTEKEESKKLERTAKQRLQALKANDEEAYIKLLDQTKDHRITHLLKQTNSFLDSLSKAVRVQQAEQDEIPLVEEPEDTTDELREKIDYYQVAHRIKEEIHEQPSILVGGKLKEYQIKGLQWMVSLYNNKLNGILADEMGLGKTIQSISLVTHLIEKKGEDKFLVIVPLSTITNWTIEFEKWAPSVKMIVYKGSPQQRKDLQYEVRTGNFQVLLTTYEYVIRERPLLARFNYSHMIIDEGHRMKNAQSKLSITLKQYYRTKNRLILTGTPLQNNLPELWALLNFVLPKIFNSVKSFDEWFNTPFANTGSQEKIELTEEESLLVIRRLHKVLRPFLLRRLKKDVEKDLPDKVEKVLKCNLSGLQHVMYQQMIKHNALFLGSQTTGTNNKSGIKGLNNKIMQLRKICNHPFVFDEVEDVMNESRLSNDFLWRTSGKFELLDRILPKFKATGHRVLIFFQMTSVMNIFEDYLRLRDMKYMRLDGSTKAEDRQDMLKSFNHPESEYFCFLLSTRAGGLGLNLQSADTVIIFDTDWNPHQDLQAQDRAHRIGQKNEVRILRLITNDSVEEVILERAHQKLDIDGKVIQAGKFDNKSTAEEQEEFLKRLLDAEQGDRDNEENDSLDDDELNDILARSEDEKKFFTEMDTKRKIEEKVQARQGGYVNRLITKEELPEVFTEDISHHFVKETKELGRMRDKKSVKYDDGLTEEQWLMAMDDDDDTVEDAIRRKEEKRARRKRKGEPDSVEPEEHTPRKRGRPPKNVSREDEDDFKGEENDEISDDPIIEKGLEVLDGIMELRAESDGHNIADIFLKLPSKKLYADYYSVIKKPVSLNQIRKQLKQEKFDTLDDFLSQIKLMCSNAKTYNEEGSWVYEDATTIENFVEAYE
ncbi:hypothetical protein JCM33374_g6446 [Metschnikowia sp. JCM 33374]|nr:hypothetical protein JCM33374_g6446 [Metschnikowia sp. JCM 33374]